MSDVYFQIPALPVLLPLWLVGVGITTAWLKRRRLLTRGRLVTVVLSATYAVAVLAATLLPLSVRLGGYANRVAWYEKVSLIPIVTIDVRTFVLNIVMTVPLGALLPLVARVRTPRQAALLTLLVSLSIELFQAVSDIVLSSGRVGDVNDLVANTIGGLVGWYVYRWLRTWTRTAGLLNQLVVPSGLAAVGLTDNTPDLDIRETQRLSKTPPRSV